MRKKVFVRWVDSALTPEWTEAPSERTGIVEIETLGYLIHEDDNHIEVAQSITEAHKSAIMSIPKSVIIEMKKVRLKK